MFAKTLSSLIVAASLAVSSLGLAATPSASGTAAPAPVAARSTKIRHLRRPTNVSKITPSAKVVAPAAQPRTPSKAGGSKVIRTSKLARPTVRTSSAAKPATR